MKIQKIAVVPAAVMIIMAFTGCRSRSGPEVEMVWIPEAGTPPFTFSMGQINVAEPVHSVTLTKGFYLGKYAVTQDQYLAIMGNNPSSFSADADPGEVQGRRPVEQVTWYDAVEFCNKLSEKKGLKKIYTITDRIPAAGYPITSATVTADWSRNGYRLPTEAEWEYACRAGTTTAWNTGDTEDSAFQAAAWYGANANRKTHEVGKKTANAWGLYDMHGNVYEWCWDWHGPYSGAETDPAGVPSGLFRIYRGGGWWSTAENCHSANRYSHRSPGYRGRGIGFRVARF
ncbi:MAG: formylglycine-generating enzyme family protein [Treponema sp.]|nr:formylglycine-generating enzyme family protein [Treponema sp.]